MDYDYRNRFSKAPDPGDGKTLKHDHPDYNRNLTLVNNFVDKIQKSLLPGMQVRLSDSEHLKKSILVISWQPPMKANKGSCATPIFLHQDHKDLGDSIDRVFNLYLRTVKDFNDKQQMKLF